MGQDNSDCPYYFKQNLNACPQCRNGFTQFCTFRGGDYSNCQTYLLEQSMEAREIAKPTLVEAALASS